VYFERHSSRLRRVYGAIVSVVGAILARLPRWLARFWRDSGAIAPKFGAILARFWRDCPKTWRDVHAGAAFMRGLQVARVGQAARVPPP
jgi:hypothetical protein